uniref:Predicted nucleic acid-binding protein, contains PIN domain n=1 Tax=Candidatus Kentrum sp. DK TaxID=2126562 RepID=A0A450TH08_9GAMM|nr:MAG: Predicted nucleic acid-binding protein, contains PIN domain [Candidatus Kentron sp. DK]
MKIYADTSVFGGVFDEEFAEDSRRFFEDLKTGKFDLVVSALVEEEIESAPRRVRAYFDELSSLAEIAEIGPEVLDLRDAYLSAGIVTRKSMDDATHVALATVSGCEMIVSWNFKHIVHFQKIPKYNAVNTLNGYYSINIYPPSSVISYDDP